ncbi:MULTISPECIES: outer membrane beta-barrel protein [Bradyrhizobium]|uniref:Beta-barrel porin-2, OmpL-like. bbp2 n=2 Tax=Bradyrhizobium TaxID=374 RepID=A0ABY0PFC5_9BRAD|nr:MULTISPECIES: outer membrane beta-barrel protein [Bradyrhizobium]SDI26489.1 Putative beta-barrel porin-2, OmpL-like. bbp2 [Bradyrhizobium ottawaense]SED69078.1 Putative beta-barrel porin-2, OmpL-like. bbp2 [Bradyrhizobium lablabi]SHL65741.1 Putative beta-barrel porin-2, OmpL-like. bbp2 [Bradyrhizobium lablabi]
MAAVGLSNVAQAADPAKGPCPYGGDPYKNYNCLDAYLGSDFFSRFINYYRLEWGHDAAPADPKAPPSRRADWPGTPQTIPPYPFTEWPYGGSTALGVTRPSSVDSPLMVALGNTAAGSWMNDNHIQVYGWVNAGGNLSSNTVRGGNVPAAYDYNPNTVQLDQAVLYIERLPDTVQKDHIDWGFRLAPIYGENYRYTTAFGLWSNQLLNQNKNYGYDMPMAYGEVFIPQIAEGLLLRFGRYISIPDIEAQLAPNNYMYTHSMTYTFDNYTNTGIQATLAANKNWMFQLGVSVGSDTMPWNYKATIANPAPNPLFPGATMPKDPGAVPSVTAGVRWTSDSGNDSIYVVGDALNSGTWGYNNLQWYGLTAYHKFNDQWHISFETYNLHQNNVLNANNPAAVAAFAAGGTPFSPQYLPFNAPGLAFCNSTTVFSCTASVQTYVAYLSYKASALDNISYRVEYYDDKQGQRTGTKTAYFETGIGWQHWFSPQIEIRPEVTYYRSLNANAFNGNANLGIPASKNFALVGAADIIIHF